ncbi:MAG TPA: YraN family protein [Rheinheimera sp.]|nr:YraN family protein [Rheinheimera sp.]
MRSRGQQFEALAEAYLLQQGLTLIERNVQCRFGEIDIVMQHAQCRVLVEVKYRASAYFGSAAAMVTPQKQQKLQTAALWYLQQSQWQGPVRFDVIAIEGESPYQINWFQNAF